MPATKVTVTYTDADKAPDEVRITPATLVKVERILGKVPPLEGTMLAAHLMLGGNRKSFDAWLDTVLAVEESLDGGEAEADPFDQEESDGQS